jgi:hypothetical protein
MMNNIKWPRAARRVAIGAITAALSMFALSLRASAAAPPLSPAAGTDIALAQLNAEPELRLQYRVERAGAPAELTTIGLSKDYHYRSSPPGLTVYDYRVRRIFRVSATPQFVNDSLYAEVWYRRMELENRAMLAAVLNKGGIDVGKSLAAQDPFWAESQLGLTTFKFARPTLQRTETNGRIAWRVNEDEVVAVRYRHDAVPAELQPSLRRLWPSIAAIHPQIADELAQSRRLPEELWVKQVDSTQKSFETAHWVLTRSEWIKQTKYPLPPHLQAAASEPQGAYPQIFQTLAASVAERRKPPSADVYKARIEAAIAQSAGLEALVWGIEMQLAAGVSANCAPPADSDFCVLAARAGPLAKMDSRTAAAFAKQSPDADQRSQFDSLPNAYMLRLLWATRPPGKGVKPEDAELDLLHALQASAVANFCKDTGDFYARTWQPFAAWQAWDLGRLMAGHISGDLLDQVDTVEGRSGAPRTRIFLSQSTVESPHEALLFRNLSFRPQVPGDCPRARPRTAPRAEARCG